MMSFHKIIKLVRTSKNLSQLELANKLNVNKSYISLIEAQKKDPGLNFIKSFAKEFGIPVSFLLWDGFDSNPVSEKDKEIKEKLKNLMKLLQEYYLNQLIKDINGT